MFGMFGVFGIFGMFGMFGMFGIFGMFGGVKVQLLGGFVQTGSFAAVVFTRIHAYTCRPHLRDAGRKSGVEPVVVAVCVVTKGEI